MKTYIFSIIIIIASVADCVIIYMPSTSFAGTTLAEQIANQKMWSEILIAIMIIFLLIDNRSKKQRVKK